MRVIKGRVYFRGRLESLSIGIDDDGRVETVRKVLRDRNAIDHGDALILPGCVDLHVHLRDPGLTHKEDASSGTRSAAIGGVTTVGEMPNTRPPVTSRAALEAKTSRYRGRISVDVALYGAPRKPEAVAALADAAAFKIYMAESTGGLQVDPKDIAPILQAGGETEKPISVHAEDPAKFDRLKATDLGTHMRVRPKESEASAIATLARSRGHSKVHVAHVTCREALEAVPEGVSCEVTPHHLFLDAAGPLGARGKVNPPLRSRADREALWEAFRHGRVDAVASDHAPHTLEEKEGPFADAPAGVPGVATSFPLLLRKVRTGEIDLTRLVSALATRPAEILGLPKGTIEIGRDADLLVVDPRRVEKITAERVRYKCGWTPFEGWEGCFPIAVYLRGEAIIDDGEPSAEGRGRILGPA